MLKGDSFGGHNLGEPVAESVGGAEDVEQSLLFQRPERPALAELTQQHTVPGRSHRNTLDDNL
ncbi:MAG: hypothetical protein Kow001_06050 [Acidobacteriota bacterium]